MLGDIAVRGQPVEQRGRHLGIADRHPKTSVASGTEPPESSDLLCVGPRFCPWDHHQDAKKAHHTNHQRSSLVSSPLDVGYQEQHDHPLRRPCANRSHAILSKPPTP